MPIDPTETETVMHVHDPDCPGGHTSDISCADVAKWRAEALANPWNCFGEGSSGYHRFATSGPEAVCEHGGCGRTRAELPLG